MVRDIKIFDASLTDAEEILKIQIRTWLTNYPNILAGITQQDIEGKIKLWQEQGSSRIKSEMQKHNAYTWVAKDKDLVVGFIAVSKDELDNRIESMHVLPEYQGQGIGTYLLTEAINWLGNDKPITLEVVSYNQGAQHFYEKFGFIRGNSAEAILLPNGKTIPKIMMTRAIHI